MPKPTTAAEKIAESRSGALSHLENFARAAIAFYETLIGVCQTQGDDTT